MTIVIINCDKVNALVDEDVQQFLEKRERSWPDWSLIKLKKSDIKKDLIYPSWFEGDWVVYSQDLNDLSKDAVKYTVHFTKNESGQILSLIHI